MQSLPPVVALKGALSGSLRTLDISPLPSMDLSLTAFDLMGQGPAIGQAEGYLPGAIPNNISQGPEFHPSVPSQPPKPLQIAAIHDIHRQPNPEATKNVPLHQYSQQQGQGVQSSNAWLQPLEPPSSTQVSGPHNWYQGHQGISSATIPQGGSPLAMHYTGTLLHDTPNPEVA